ncbi:MAG: PAS domain S-box protein [Chlorobi bacterium CHB2]|nr:PAS domain S-box protein [Chlorobi bacterium CHB2]
MNDKTRFLYYIVESSQVAQVALDEQASIQYINPFFCSLYGYQAEEVIGQHVSILSGEDEPEAHYLNLLKVAGGQDAWRGEDWRRRKLHCHAWGARLRGAWRNPPGAHHQHADPPRRCPIPHFHPHLRLR